MYLRRAVLLLSWANLLQQVEVQAFLVPQVPPRTQPQRQVANDSSSRLLRLQAAGGRGMGMTSSASTKNKSKSASSSSSGGGGGMGGGMGKAKNGGSSNNKKKAAAVFDAKASVARLEKRYDELIWATNKEMAKESAKEEKEEEEDPRWASNSDDNSSSSGRVEEKTDDNTVAVNGVDTMTSEYVVAARAMSKKGGVHDWVPVAQLCLYRPTSEYHNGASDELVQAAISSYCRELSHIATLGAPVFSTVARNDLQYSVESLESFRKHVYESVVEGGAKQHPDNVMSKADARMALGLSSSKVAASSSLAEEKNNGVVATVEKSDIKQAYRKLSFQLHPDRFEGTPEECEEAAVRFGRVKLAYETLISGVRGNGASWYESLGGRARTDFVGPVNLLPLVAAQEQMQRKGAEGALCGLDRDMIQTFVVRNLRSE